MVKSNDYSCFKMQGVVHSVLFPCGYHNDIHQPQKGTLLFSSSNFNENTLMSLGSLKVCQKQGSVCTIGSGRPVKMDWTQKSEQDKHQNEQNF